VPDQLGFEGFKTGLNNLIIVAITLATHGYQKAIYFKPFLMIIRAMVTATISVMDAISDWLAQGNSHIERPDRQIALHVVANGPANHTTRIQIQDDGQIQPPFASPYVGDVASLFLIGRELDGVC